MANKSQKKVVSCCLSDEDIEDLGTYPHMGYVLQKIISKIPRSMPKKIADLFILQSDFLKAGVEIALNKKAVILRATIYEADVTKHRQLGIPINFIEERLTFCLRWIFDNLWPDEYGMRISEIGGIIDHPEAKEDGAIMPDDLINRIREVEKETGLPMLNQQGKIARDKFIEITIQSVETSSEENLKKALEGAIEFALEKRSDKRSPDKIITELINGGYISQTFKPRVLKNKLYSVIDGIISNNLKYCNYCGGEYSKVPHDSCRSEASHRLKKHKNRLIQVEGARYQIIGVKRGYFIARLYTGKNKPLGSFIEARDKRSLRADLPLLKWEH